MNYRKFGLTEWNVSSIALGLSRLPLDNETECIGLIHEAIDKGINYIDVGMPYDRVRNQRICAILGKALHGTYRERVKVSLTLPVFRIVSRDDFDLCLHEQLEWLNTDMVDFCALGRITRDNWPHLESIDVSTAMDHALSAGKVLRFGFSFHDHFQILKKVIAAYDKWSFCQVQFSYMDIDHDPGTSGIRYAGVCGLAVVVTEAMKSGRLVQNLPDTVTQAWDGSTAEHTLAEWALRFVLSFPEVSTVVNTMNTKDQITENVNVIESACPDCISVMDELLLARIRDAYRKARSVACPSCRPCMPCPVGIDVPRIFEIYNDAFMYQDFAAARAVYQEEGHNADMCTECGICAGRCAKRLDIPELLKKVRDLIL